MADLFQFPQTLANWQQLTRPRASDLADTRNQLHWAAQLVAALGSTLTAARSDFAHTSLVWSHEHRGLVSQPTDTSPSLRALLRFPDVSISLIRDYGEVSETIAAKVTLEGKSFAQAQAELEAAVGRQLGRAQKLERPQHDLPVHRVDPEGEGGAFGGWKAHALSELTSWYANGAQALAELGRYEPRASPVRCWPHHFDIATLLVVARESEDPDAAITASIGVGMTPGDDNYVDAYWYVNCWPNPSDPELPELAGGGIWHRTGWLGAVLTSTALRNPQAENFVAFMCSGIEACDGLIAEQRAQTSTKPKASDAAGPIRSKSLVWHRVAELDELPEGRVKAVTCGTQTVCLTHFEGEYAALDNRCPHQGGPLGEGSIENGWLRCPWHGWDYHPTTGKSPGSHDDGVDCFPLEVREEGVFVGFEPEADSEEGEGHQATVSDVMVETMVNWGIRWVFGMVGHSNLGLADGIRRVVMREHEKPAPALRYVGIRHEGAAAFAISAYGKLTGRPAAALTIAGPGATNLLTGLWDANVDRAPALALTGQVQSQVLGRGAFQELPLQQAFGQVAKFGHPVLHESNHVELMNLACKSAILERGVSHLIFPDEVQNIPAEGVQAGSPVGRMPALEIQPAASSLRAAHDRIRQAKRPVIIVGHGAREDMAAIIELAEQLGSPVITTFKAKGQISDHHALGCGVLGRSGTPIASWFMNEADLLVVFGSSFSNHTGISAKLPIVQIDWERSALGRFHAVEVPVWGAIAPTVAALLEAGRGGVGTKVDQRAEIATRWALWRDEKASRRQDDRGKGLNSATIFEALSRLVPADALIPVDVGNNTYSFGRYFECRDQRVMMSGYLGSIGFGLPAAMGAWAASQEPGTPWFGRKVVSISGDGGFGQYLGELTTLVKYGMNITHVLLDNHELGKISKEQRGGQWPVWETTMHNPDFARYADNCGALGISVNETNELDAALTRAFAHAGPSLVHIRSDAALI